MIIVLVILVIGGIAVAAGIAALVSGVANARRETRPRRPAAVADPMLNQHPSPEQHHHQHGQRVVVVKLVVRILKSFAWALVAAIVVGLGWAILQIAFGVSEMIAISGSGGLGAVSAGVSEALVEAGGITFVIVFAWRLWRTRPRATRTVR